MPRVFFRDASARSIALVFEKLSVAVLRRNSFVIEHCRRTGDEGNDLKGHCILLDKEISVIGMYITNDYCNNYNYI